MTTASPAMPTPAQPDAPAKFFYEAQTVDGQIFRGLLEGESPEIVRSRLAALQLRVLSVDPAPLSPPVKFRRPLSHDDFVLFNQQLAHLTSAGLPVERGLRLVAADLRSGRLANAANDVAADLERGVPLKDAFSQHASRFPPLYGQLLQAGANVGNLPGMLFNLGRHLDLANRLRQSLWRTLAYPLTVLAALAAVLLFLSLMVLPRFAYIFGDFRVDLPVLTKIILAFGTVYPTFLLILLVFILILVGINFILNYTGHGSLLRDTIFLRLPLIGQVLRASLLARWLDALRLGVESGLDLPRAITLAADATGAGGRIAVESAAFADVLAHGQPATAFTGNFIPPTIPAAIELASATGVLPDTLLTLTRMYEQHAEQRLVILPTVLTPILMLFVGGSVAFCLAAMFLPLVKLIQSVSGGDM